MEKKLILVESVASIRAERERSAAAGGTVMKEPGGGDPMPGKSDAEGCSRDERRPLISVCEALNSPRTNRSCRRKSGNCS